VATGVSLGGLGAVGAITSNYNRTCERRIAKLRATPQQKKDV